MINYLVSALVGYLLGSIPVAYIILKYHKNIDITKEGSQNVGALNSYRVSDSKVIASIVFLLDFLKGFLSVGLILWLFGSNFQLGITTLFFAVLAHCYSPWIKFRGGRGLATAAGGAVLISFPVLVLWAVFWSATYIYRKHIHFASVSATVLSMIIVLTSGEHLLKWNKIYEKDLLFFIISVDLVFLIILIKHLPTIMEYLKLQNKNVRKDKS